MQRAQSYHLTHNKELNWWGRTRFCHDLISIFAWDHTLYPADALKDGDLAWKHLDVLLGLNRPDSAESMLVEPPTPVLAPATPSYPSVITKLGPKKAAVSHHHSAFTAHIPP